MPSRDVDDRRGMDSSREKEKNCHLECADTRIDFCRWESVCPDEKGKSGPPNPEDPRETGRDRDRGDPGMDGKDLLERGTKAERM